MRFTPLRSLALLALPLALLASGCSDTKTDTATSDTTTTVKASVTTAAPAAKGKTIVDIAAGDPQFSTLVSLVTAAGLAETLSGPGPFTVFAPTNDAFAKLPAATVTALKADPKGALADVLKLHVISGKVDSKAAIAAAGTMVKTLGGEVSVEAAPGKGVGLTIGGAVISAVDIEASNGVVHVLDDVITAAK